MRTAAIGVLTLLTLSGCAAVTPDPPAATEPPAFTASPTPSAAQSEPTDRSRPTNSASPAGAPRVVREIATGLAVPWGLAFLPDGRAVVTERDTGRVVIVTATGQVTPIGNISEVAPGPEGGLLGVAVSPDFATDRTVFLYVSTASDNRILRATINQSRLDEVAPILTGIPVGARHDGGRIEFGPDGYLYASTGEIGEDDLAQDPASLAGKILRMTPQGQPAPGNPDPESVVWSIGHRNVQGLAWDTAGNLWASEFGNQLWDELNLVTPGANYGWPILEGTGNTEGLTNPKVVWRTDVASPSGLAHLDGYLWLAALRGERLWRIPVRNGETGEPQDFFVGHYGRLRTVVPAPDGNLWVTTSNRDGRRDPSPGDDRILLLRP